MQRHSTSKLQPGAILRTFLPSEISLNEEIGRGATANVHKATIKASGEVCAAKMYGSTVTDELPPDIAALQALDHPDVVKLFGIIEDKDGKVIGILMELLHGNLEEYLSKHPELSFEDRLAKCYFIACAIEFAHKNGIVHADINPENILVKNVDETKLCGFSSSYRIATQGGSTASGMHGSFLYVAPEYANGEDLDTRCDVFSFGMLMWVSIHHPTPPFEKNLTPVQLLRKIDKGDRPMIDSAKCPSDTARKLIEACWDGDPAKRPTMAEARHRLSIILRRFVNRLDRYVSAADVALSRVRRNPVTETSHVREVHDIYGFKKVNEYSIVEEVGRGSRGKVELAFKGDSDVPLAIKVIPRRKGMDEHLQMEIAIMQKLRHKNIVTLHEVIDDPEQDKLYLVMDFIEFGPIAKLSEQGTCKPLPQPKLVRCMRQLVRCLLYMHWHGVAYRDVKPENILLGSNDQVYLADFGVSEFVGPGSTAADLRKRGTPAFFAPEICSSGPEESISSLMILSMSDTFVVPANEFPIASDVAAEMLDVWALGVSLFVLSFGFLPFNGTETVELYRSIREDPVPFPANTPFVLRDVLKRMLTKDPNDRIKLWTLKSHPYIRPAFKIAEVEAYAAPANLKQLEAEKPREIGLQSNANKERKEGGVDDLPMSASGSGIAESPRCVTPTTPMLPLEYYREKGHYIPAFSSDDLSPTVCHCTDSESFREITHKEDDAEEQKGSAMLLFSPKPVPPTAGVPPPRVPRRSQLRYSIDVNAISSSSMRVSGSNEATMSTSENIDDADPLSGDSGFSPRDEHRGLRFLLQRRNV